ncbi:peptide deformylase [Thioflexithrix psekupsensis]|uniref:Peptide deformylase n=1 Tax=Thioflexithrix psekupsensis TaxID=1570016 RepID=A0A251X5N9_9GAMM|nr:peptide deformylase [Thioflexithrix psekupsensis]OUD12462.1 peptide deformylase [Thioflexithrix psekupsensis]
MALLTILHYPDARLRVEARPVVKVDGAIRDLVTDMLETMYAARGIGLAATQVNVPQQVVVIDVSEDRDEPQVFINPRLVAQGGVETMEEGCLSVPSIYGEVERAEWVEVEALNQNGDVFRIKADGLLAVCLQHEMDHLKGKLFVDYLSPLKRQRIRKKLEKQKAD